MKSKSVAEGCFRQSLLAKAVSPMIATTVLIAVAIAIAGIAYVWTSSYTTIITEQVTEQAGPEIIESPAISQALTIKSALSNGRIIISNDGITEVIIDKVVVDGNIVFIVPPVTIPAGGQAVIDLNMTLSPGMSIGLLTSTGVGTEIVLTADEFPVTGTGMEESIMFRDLLDNTNDINLSQTDANMAGSEAKLGTVITPGTVDWNVLGDLNVSNNLGASGIPSLKLDVNGNPSIAWYDNTLGNNEVYYLDWNGTNWVTASGSTGTTNLNVSSNSSNSFEPSLALDVNGNPSIAWHDYPGTTWTSGKVYYRDWNGTNWVTIAGDLSGPSLTITPFGVANRWGFVPSLKLDVNGNPSIAFYAYTSSWEIFYYDWNGTDWAPAAGGLSDPSRIVSNNAGISDHPSLALDVNGNPSIAWFDNTLTNFDVYYLDWNGTNWVTASGSTGTTKLNVSNNPGTSYNVVLALDVNGNPSMTWKDDTSGNEEIYYRNWNGTNWVTPSGPDWLSGWDYRKKFDINGTVDGNLTNYQLKLYVKRSTGTDLNGTVFVGTNVLSDYNDLRFTRADGNTLLDYWIEDANSDTGIVWVEFNSVLASPTANTFYMYYGNSSASKDSNGVNTFILFDDFDDGSLDTTTRWTKLNVATESSGEVAVTYSGSESRIYSKNAYAVNTAIRMRNKMNGDYSLQAGYWDGGGEIAFYSRDGASAYFRLAVGNSGGSTVLASTFIKDPNYHIVDIIRNSTTSIILNIDGPTVATHTNPTYTPVGSIAVILRAPLSSGINTTDWIFVRKYTANEPVWTNWRAEETNLNVSKNSGASVWPSLALDVNYNPSIAWQDNTSGNNEIYYRDWNGSNWTTVKGNLYDADLNVSKNSGSSNQPSLALDANGNPRIAWADDFSGNGEIYFRKWRVIPATSGFAYGSVVYSGIVDTVSQNITKATLRGNVLIPANTAISFFLSNNNGATWAPATLGTETTFGSTGSQLRWRADLNTDNILVTPRIYDANIFYVYQA